MNLTDPTGMFVNAEYASDPAHEMDADLDWSKKRALWTNEMELALAAYQQMVDTTLAQVRQRNRQKKQQEKAQPQVVNLQDSQVINQRIEEINKNAKPLAPGETAVATNIDYVPGEVIQLNNAIVNLPNGTTQPVAQGYLRAVAVIVTDQNGNIMKDPNLTVTEKVTAVDKAAKDLEKAGSLRTSNNIPVSQASNGVFYDAQIRGMGTSRLTYQTAQDVTIKSGRKGLWRIEGNQITTDDKSRSITINRGQIRRFY